MRKQDLKKNELETNCDEYKNKFSGVCWQDMVTLFFIQNTNCYKINKDLPYSLYEHICNLIFSPAVGRLYWTKTNVTATHTAPKRFVHKVYWIPNIRYSAKLLFVAFLLYIMNSIRGDNMIWHPKSRVGDSLSFLSTYRAFALYIGFGAKSMPNIFFFLSA